jgi:hypothetical protein
LAASAWFGRRQRDSRSTQNTFYNQDDPSIREEVLNSRLGGFVPCVLQFFSGFYGIILAELQIDPQVESTIRPKARGLHSIWNVILRITFSIWFLLQDSVSTIEGLQEKNSRMLANYSRRLQDYSRISWSTFQPRDASSILKDFRLVVLKNACGLLVWLSRLLESILLDYKVLGGLTYGPP